MKTNPLFSFDFIFSYWILWKLLKVYRFVLITKMTLNVILKNASVMLIVILIFHSEINQSTDYENMKVTRIRNMGTFSHVIFLNILMYNVHNSYAKNIHIINKLASDHTAHPNNNFQLKIRLKQILIIFQQLANKGEKVYKCFKGHYWIIDIQYLCLFQKWHGLHLNRFEIRQKCRRLVEISPVVLRSYSML